MGEKRLKGDKKHTHSECITLRCAPSNVSTLKKKKKKPYSIYQLRQMIKSQLLKDQCQVRAFQSVPT
jgi:hypothetical protein